MLFKPKKESQGREREDSRLTWEELNDGFPYVKVNARNGAANLN